MFHRAINISKTQSFFLFGARGTGKSTLLERVFSAREAFVFDLLDDDTERALSRRPQELKDRIQSLPKSVKWIVIDEVQRIPRLLNVVHSLIETTPLKFALTGSSARKLRRGHANLLAGRAVVYNLYPLQHAELEAAFNLEQALDWGTLPRVFALEKLSDRRAFLRSYALTYLKEEIVAEQVVRNLEPFRHFLEVAAQADGRLINFSNIADDVGVDIKTVQSYFQMLEDTLIATLLPSFHRAVRKRQKTSPKFYLFDGGVRRALEGTLGNRLPESSYAYGAAFESFVINEMIALNSYQTRDWRFSYLRTKDDAEIDQVIERPGLPLALVEIKSTRQVLPKHVATLNRLAPEFGRSECFCLSRDPAEKRIGATLVLPWEKGLTALGLR